MKYSSRKMISKLFSGLLALLVCLATFGVYFQAVQASALDLTKLDQDFYQELEQNGENIYYDTIIVFNEKSDTALLDRFNRQVKTFRVLPMARVLLNKNEIAEVTQWPQVLYVEPNKRLKTFNREGRALTNSDYVQAELGLDGASVEVAVVDTGADGTHPDLKNMLHNWQVVGTLIGDGGYVSSTPDGINVQTVIIDVQNGAGLPINTDEYGHGTHVFGTIAGTGDGSEGNYRGMAPAAKVHSYSASAGILLVFTLEAYDHIMYQNQQGMANIKVVNNSWGSEGCNFAPFNATNVSTRMAYEQGILSVFAYGNSGPSPDTCNPYATAPYVLGVAATDKAYKITGFSSRGKVDGNYDREQALANLYEYLASSREVQQTWDFSTKPIGLYRPSVSAPGQDIVSAQNPVHPMTLSGTIYGSASGTSMAAPHVTGVMALIVDAYNQYHPTQTLQPIDLIRLAEVTANKEVMYGYNTYDTGAGFIDAKKAVERAIQNDIPSRVTDSDLVYYVPPVTKKEVGQYTGTVLPNSYQTNIGYGVHEISVKPGALKVYADATWSTQVEKVYISLYAPGLDVEKDSPTVSSAGLLDITNKRFVEFNFPEPGVWKVRIDGRVNLATNYTGTWEVHHPLNSDPTGFLEVTPNQIKGNQPISIVAEISDPDGLEDLIDVQLNVRASNGRVIGSWSKADFTVMDHNTARLTVSEFSLTGKAPWTVELTAVDATGNRVFKQAFIGKK